MIHTQTGSEKVPAAHLTLHKAWYPKNQDRVALLRMAGTPAYALGRLHYSSSNDKGQADLRRVRQQNTRGTVVIRGETDVSMCINPQKAFTDQVYATISAHYRYLRCANPVNASSATFAYAAFARVV